MVYLLHAYSPKNSGDGLLVSLSIKKIRRTKGYEDKLINIICLDKSSFIKYLDEFDNINVISWLEFLKNSFINRGDYNKYEFFAVGGGYLRAGHFSESIKTILAHGSQILATKLYKNRTYHYFAQSVGPFNGVWGYLLKKIITNVKYIEVRDDKSGLELKLCGINVMRVPDLVAQEIIHNKKNIKFKMPESKKDVCFVFRSLPQEKFGIDYINKYKELLKAFPGSYLGLQSEGRGNDDAGFYNEFFSEYEVTPMKDVFKNKKSLVVSVRLHGSLESILNNHLSYHIAYERKGIAAFGDLNLDEFVTHINSINIEKTINDIKLLVNNSESYQEKFYCEN